MAVPLLRQVEMMPSRTTTISPRAISFIKKGYEVRVDVEAAGTTASLPIAGSRKAGRGRTAPAAGIFKFDQENMQWSGLATEKDGRGAEPAFRRRGMVDGEPRTWVEGAAGANGPLGSHPLSDRIRRLPGGDLCLSCLFG